MGKSRFTVDYVKHTFILVLSFINDHIIDYY